MKAGYKKTLKEVVDLLHAARRASARAVNTVITTTYWEIGRKIVMLEQGGQRRAGYGEQLIARLSEDLMKQFGRGFGARNLAQMRAFYLAFPRKEILQAPPAKSEFPLPWTHYVNLLSVDDPVARDFYHSEALRIGWSSQQWTHPDENPSVGLILCAKKDEMVAKYSLEGLPNKVVAAQYRTTLPGIGKLVAEMKTAQRLIALKRQARNDAT